MERQQQQRQQGNEEQHESMIKHITSVTGVDELNRVQELDEAATATSFVVCDHNNNNNNKIGTSSSTSTAGGGGKNDNNLVNVLASSLGARVLFATDEWFATADNLINDTVAPTFDPNAYCAQGKVMDGWESRRRREAGHDWCIIQLATTTTTATTSPSWSCWSHVDVDTAYFTGNQVPAISIQVAHLSISEQAQLVQQLPGGVERLLRHGKGIRGMGALPEQVQQAQNACEKYADRWTEILPRTSLQPGYEESRHHMFPITIATTVNNSQNDVPATATLVKVNYYPDGGVARLRLWAKQQEGSSSHMALPPVYMPITTGRRCTVVSHSDNNNDHSHLPSRQPHPQDHIELSSSLHDGQGIACSNQHYGTPNNLIQESLGRDMGDGWETARHPNRPPILVLNTSTNLIDNNLSDWCIIKLGGVARHGISRIILDTKHFRGNYPESVQVQGALLLEHEKYDDSNVDWFDFIARCRMSPDAEHVFDAHLQQLEQQNAQRPVSLIRVTVFPDGGLSRVRVYGQADDGNKATTATASIMASHL